MAHDTRQGSSAAERHVLGARALQAMTVVTGGFAASMVLTPWPSHLFSRVALGDWTTFATRGEVGSYVEFSYAVIGATMIGWMFALWWIVGQVRSGTPGAWGVAVMSIVGWFVVDSTTSVLRGYPGNAALNLVFAVPFAIGLWLTRPRRAAG